MKEKKRSFLFHSAVYWSGKMLSRSISIILLPIFTAYIVPSEYGILSVLAIVMDVLMLVVSLQLPTAIYRFWAKAESEDERCRIMGTSFIVTVLFPAGILLPLYVWSGPFVRILSLGNEHIPLVRLVLFEVQIALVLSIILADMRIRDESRLYALIEIIQNLSIGIFSILLVVYMGWGISGMIIAQVGVFFLVTVSCIPRFIRRISFVFDMVLTKKMIRFSFPLIPAAVAMAAVHTSDRLFIQQMLGTAATGIYAVGYKFGMLVSFLITGPFLLIWEPKSFEIAHGEGSTEKYGEVFTFLVVGVLFVAVALTGLSQEIVNFMVDLKYRSAAMVIPWVSWSYVFFAMAMVVRVGLLVEKKTAFSAGIVFVVFVVNLAGNLVLIKTLGLAGAAVSTLISFIAYFILNLFFSYRYIPIKFEFIKLLQLTVLAAGASLLMHFIQGGGTIKRIVFKLCILLTMLSLLFLLGFFSKLEIPKKLRALHLLR